MPQNSKHDDSPDVDERKHRSFRRSCRATLVAVYCLIVIGGVVRSTGAGMGCPDWPTCFGRLVPPVSESQLPGNYKEIYLAKRQAKNEKLARMLSGLGFVHLANDLRHEQTLSEENEFNPAKTWTEYLNRLAGVSVGFLFIATFIFSFSYRRTRPLVIWLAALALLTVGFNGWAGSLVVSTNLLPWMVTVHMLLALLLVALLVLLLQLTRPKSERWRLQSLDLGPLKVLLSAAVVCMVLQVAMGTQVRENVDTVARMMDNTLRDTWIQNLGLIFYVHRSFSILLVVLSAALFWLARRRASGGHPLVGWCRALFFITLFEVAAGAVLAYFALPAMVQPLHLGLAAIIFGFQLQILLRLNGSSSPA